MVGLEVTPATWNWSRRRRSSPFWIQSRAIESTQTATPWSVSCCKRDVIGSSLSECLSVLSVQPAEQLTGPVGDVLGGEAELLQDHVAGGRGAAVVPGDDLAVLADPAAPAEAGGGLHRYPGADPGGQDLVAVALVLVLEQLPAGHRHHPGGDAVGLEQVAGIHGHPDLGAGGDQDQPGLAPLGPGENVGPLVQALRPRVGRARALGAVPGGA